jgi:ribosomal protein L14E/L6E/L27E
MKMLVGAIVGMLEENLSEVTDPEVKKGIENYKKEMEELYAQILLSEFMENMMEKMEVES